MKSLLIFTLLLFSLTVTSQKLGLSEYDKPDLLLKLEAYEKEGGSFKPLGFDELNDQNNEYRFPIDVIPFATSEYFHIGFLTDFGTIPDLDQAPIVHINNAPWEKEYKIALVAENLEMFLALVCQVETAHIIDHLATKAYMTTGEVDDMMYESEYGFQLQKAKGTPSKEEWLQKRKADRENTLKYLKKQVGHIQVDSVELYLEALNNKRSAAVAMDTNDGLGIIYPGASQVDEPFDFEEEITVEKVENYLSKTSEAERLKFYRDATFVEENESSLFDPYRFEKKEIKQFRKILYDYLIDDGYDYEARVLKKFYK